MLYFFLLSCGCKCTVFPHKRSIHAIFFRLILWEHRQFTMRFRDLPWDFESQPGTFYWGMFCPKIFNIFHMNMQTVQTHAQLSNFAIVKTSVGPRQANLVLIAYASSDGSGEPAHPRSLPRTSAARLYKQWVKRNLQTESQIPSPSEWLGMRS